MIEPSAATVTPPHGSPALAFPGVSWMALCADDAYVAVARRFAQDVLAEHVRDADHAHSVHLIVSELVTNAIRTARSLPGPPPDPRPVCLGLEVTARYVHLAVTDPDPRPIDATIAPNPDPDSGWGLHIVDALAAARWTTHGDHGKAVHALVPAPGVVLTPAELATAGAPP